jgi:predicted permease
MDFLPILTVFWLIAVGYLARHFGLVKRETGEQLLVLTIFVILPAKVLQTVSGLALDSTLWVLALSVPVAVALNYAAGKYFSNALALPRRQAGAFRTGLAITNTGFVLIFALTLLDAAGVAKLLLLDRVSSLFVHTVAYSLSAKHSSALAPSRREIARRVLTLPPFIATVVALALSVTGTALPGWTDAFLTPLAVLTMPALALSTGMVLDIKPPQKPALTMTAVKLGGGLLAGFAFVTLFGLSGVDRKLAIAAFASPAGFNMISYAAREKLDVEFAASLFFWSALVGMFLTPLILLFA